MNFVLVNQLVDVILLTILFTIQISSSNSDMEGDDSEDEDIYTMRCMQLQRQIQTNLCLTACIMDNYYSTYHDKNEPRTSRLSGCDRVMET